MLAISSGAAFPPRGVSLPSPQSIRAGGKRRASLAAGLFPVIAMTSLVGFLTIIGKFVYAKPNAKPQWVHFSMAVLFGSILPGMALLSGAAPFAKAREYRSA